jgi:hypothetical protein
MTLALTIGGVDGETNFLIHAVSAEVVLGFLSRYDHEGSVVTLRVEAESEQAYALLKQLALLERQR